MNKMATRSFNRWFSTFRKSINEYHYYTDFARVVENAEKLKTEIYILNSLIHAKDIEMEFETILTKYPECIKVIPILLAVRNSEIYCQDANTATTFRFDKVTQSIEQYKYFMKKTGLFEMLQKHIISSLYDYVTGVEVGLDSNGRKNRGGHQMETLVENYLKKSGVEYYKEMYSSTIEQTWNLDLSAISADGTSSKRWDFVVKAPTSIFAIETNFYTSAGSKLNETARSYKMIAEEAKMITGFRFLWITDGVGWNSSKGSLEETFNALSDLYNIADMENGIFLKLFR